MDFLQFIKLVVTRGRAGAEMVAADRGDSEVKRFIEKQNIMITTCLFPDYGVHSHNILQDWRGLRRTLRQAHRIEPLSQ